MNLRFTRTAARQLDRILTEISLDAPTGARNVHERIKAVLGHVVAYPLIGKATARRNIRRLVVTPYPYVITYRVGEDEVVIRTIRHGARRPL